MTWYDDKGQVLKTGDEPAPISGGDINHKLRAIKGEMSEEDAQRTLGQFIGTNIGYMTRLLTGFILEAYQRIVIKGWMQKNFALTIASRSFGKSMLFAHFCYLYCLLNPNHHVLMVSATFRSSRKVLENIDSWSKKKTKGADQGGELLRQTFAGDMTKKADLYVIRFKNGSTITAVPLGDPDNLRGFRCNVLGIDEGLLIPKSTIELVLKPFLAGGADATKKQRVREKERRRIKEGTLREEDRKVFKSTSKMIILSSASYKWEELYERYKDYLKIITKQTDEKSMKAEMTDKGESSYLVQQMSYEVVNPDLMDSAILKEIKERLIPDSIINREYKAQFTDESDGYFSARLMSHCTIQPGNKPHIELVGEKSAKYILAIDPNAAAGAAADHFAMCLIKICEREDGRKFGLVVHNYACAGVELKHHVNYLFYLWHRFNIVYIICDTSAGDNLDFVNICNESEQFKTKNIEFNAIDAEFGKDAYDDMIKAVRKGYNPDSLVRRIVQKQSFNPSFLRAANEHLQACFDRRIILFASAANSVPNAPSILSHQDVMDVHRTHPEFASNMGDGEMSDKGGSGDMYEFITTQDNLIDLVKKECALIEVTSNPGGSQSYDLPHHMTRNRKNENRIRKDSYSALLLGSWAFKVYTGSQDLPEEKVEEWIPVWGR